jgi:hypothetical protein
MGNLQDKLNWKQCEEVTFEEDNPKFAALLAESDESRSEYKAPDDSSETESNEEATGIEEGPKLENEEPDTNIQLKTGKKQKKGVIAQDQISAVVAAINDGPSPRLDSDRSKRAASKT